MSRPTPLQLAALATGLFGMACQQTIPKNQFNPRTGDLTVRNLTFANVKMKRTLDPKLLRPPTDSYILGPGDIVEIEIAEVPGTLARTFVMPDGMVYYNLAGGVHAEGLTQAAFSKQLAEALKRDYSNPLINVSLVEVRSRRYWILGRVFKPGIFPLRQPTTLLEAISESGGLFTSRFSGTTQELADLSNSVIIRDGDILPVKFDKLINEGDTSQNVYLRHNDFIYLPSASTSTVLLLGAVSVPQAISYKDSLTLVDCIAQAKGPTKEAHLTHAVIVRGTLEKPSAAIVNLKAILTGKETDVLLQPGDIVWLPTRPLGLLDSTVKLIFQDAARSYAASQGSSMVGSAQNPNLSLPLSQPTQSTTP